MINSLLLYNEYEKVRGLPLSSILFIGLPLDFMHDCTYVHICT